MAAQKVTEAEVKEAVQRFQAGGGVIRTLPPECVLPDLLVGCEYGIYESITGQQLGGDTHE